MGGIIRDKQNATHFFVSLNKTNILKGDIKENWKLQYKVNLKFLFHSFFFMMKTDEKDTEYSELF